MPLVIESRYAEFRYAECRNYLNVMLSVFMLNVVLLSAIMLNVVMLSVVAPIGPHSQHFNYFVTYVWANKLKCYTPLSWKGFPGKNTLAYWVHS
jgi:hypothetical protein